MQARSAEPRDVIVPGERRFLMIEPAALGRTGKELSFSRKPAYAGDLFAIGEFAGFGLERRYGLAIAKNVEAIGGELDTAWNAPGGIQDDWKHPSADNPVYRDNGEAIQALIGLHVNGLEMVRDKRIKLFYRGKGAKVSPKAAIFWRSGNTARALAANIDGLGTLWKVSDMGALLPEDVRSLADSAGFDYRTAVAALRKLDPPTAEALNDKKYLARLDFIEFTLKDAIKRVNNDVGGAVGLGAGFSFSDGD